MKYSAESRWFYETSPADEAIIAWFAGHGQLLTEGAHRTDLYLINHMPSKSIKLREGRVEVKINVHNWEEELRHDNFTRSNSWKKYSFVLEKDDEDAAQVLRDFAGLRSIGVNHDWIRLDKERMTVSYVTVPESGTFRLAEAGERPEQGCAVDYTRINVNLRKTFYSFGFEAYGNAMTVKKSLDLAMQDVFTSGEITGLTKASAMAFPEFLLGV
jgi:hypothetical protein